MPRGRPPGSKNRTPRRQAAGAEGDRRLLEGVRGLVERVTVLEAENRRLRELLAEISKSLRLPVPGASAAAQTATRRRGRPPKTAVAAVRPRRKITDPKVLEQRRKALAKARAVRAERLAAARS